MAARSESCCSSLVMTLLSWARASLSVFWLSLSVLGRLRPRLGRLLASASARCSAVSESRVPACPMGTHTNVTRPHSWERAWMSGWYLEVFSSVLRLRLRSAPNPTSISSREHCFLSNAVVCVQGEFGTPLA